MGTEATREQQLSPVRFEEKSGVLEQTFQTIAELVAADGLTAGFDKFGTIPECRKTIELLQSHPGLAAYFVRKNRGSSEFPKLLCYLLLCHYSKDATESLYSILEPVANSFLAPAYKRDFLESISERGDWIEILVVCSQPTMQRSVNRYWTSYHIFLRDLIKEFHERAPKKLTMHFDEHQFFAGLRGVADPAEEVAFVYAFADIISRIDWWAPVLVQTKGLTVVAGYFEVDNSIMVRALRGSFCPGVLDAIFRVIANGLNSYKGTSGLPVEVNYHQIHHRRSIPMGYHQARALTSLLPRLTGLELNLDERWSEEAAICILEAVEASKAIRKLNLSLGEDLFGSSQPPLVALQDAIAKNTSVVSFETHCTGQKATEFLLDALAQNSTIHRLEVRALPDPRKFAHYLSDCRLASIAIRMHHGTLENNWNGWEFRPSCQLRSVTIDGKVNLFLGLISALGQLPLLEELTISQKWKKRSRPCPTNITQQLLQGTTGGQIKKLELENVNVKVSVLGEILKANNRLKDLQVRTLNVFDSDEDEEELDEDREDEEDEDYRCKATQKCIVGALQNHCLRLTNVYTVSRTRHNVHRELSKIDYYLALNELVREDLMDFMEGDELLCAKDKVIDLLLRVRVATQAGNTRITRSLERFGGEGEHVAQYELLRTVPYLWCGR